MSLRRSRPLSQPSGRPSNRRTRCHSFDSGLRLGSGARISSRLRSVHAIAEPLRGPNLTRCLPRHATPAGRRGPAVAGWVAHMTHIGRRRPPGRVRAVSVPQRRVSPERPDTGPARHHQSRPGHDVRMDRSHRIVGTRRVQAAMRMLLHTVWCSLWISAPNWPMNDGIRVC